MPQCCEGTQGNRCSHLSSHGILRKYKLANELFDFQLGRLRGNPKRIVKNQMPQFLGDGVSRTVSHWRSYEADSGYFAIASDPCGKTIKPIDINLNLEHQDASTLQDASNVLDRRVGRESQLASCQLSRFYRRLTRSGKRNWNGLEPTSEITNDLE